MTLDIFKLVVYTAIMNRETRTANSLLKKQLNLIKLLIRQVGQKIFNYCLKEKKYLHTIVNQGMLACKAALHHN